MNHRFTIIVPTRERANTLEYCLMTCIAQDYDNLEIIVCDNASQDNTHEVVNSIKDPRVRYINPGRRLSMMENFEYAFSHANNGYVFSMGDDDGLPRDAISRVNQIIDETKTKALISDFAHYFWPNVNADAAGQFIFSRKKGYEIRSSKSDLNQVLYSRRAFNHLPCIYYGFIEVSVLQQLRQMHGRLFASNIVDLFSSVAISLLIDEYVFSHEPLAINGTSNRSNGAAFMKIGNDSSEKLRWYQENTTTSLPPFTTTGSIKMMLAEACYALTQMRSPLNQKFTPDFQKMLEQAHLDVALYKKSNIDPTLIQRICSELGYPNIKPSKLVFLCALIELYWARLPKFIHSEILDSRVMGVTNVDMASELLDQQLKLPKTSAIDRMRLLYERYKATR
jgi:glycosyltransferase involved in cell wall biosynthesis